MSRTALLVLSLSFLCAASCGKHSDPAPAPTPIPAPAPTPTRILTLTGDLTFGAVNIGTSTQRKFTIHNDGNSTLTFTSLSGSGGTGSTGFSASPTSGAVGAGGGVDVTVAFTPTLTQNYNTLMTVTSDQTNVGYHQTAMSGTGVNPNPLFAISGTGDSVFDLPGYVARIKVVGTYTQSSSNFIVRIDGRLIVNELVGTFWGQTRYEGTLLTGLNGTTKGVIAITNSSGVGWSFTEVR